MTESSKAAKDRDRLIVRVPDGMKERVERRAQANGRSVNSEIVEMLEYALGRTPQTQLDKLTHEYRVLLLEMDEAKARASAAQDRLWAIQDQISMAVGGKPMGDGDDPVAYLAEKKGRPA